MPMNLISHAIPRLEFESSSRYHNVRSSQQISLLRPKSEPQLLAFLYGMI